MVIFRENTEDLYAGIEWQAGTADAQKVSQFLKEEMGVNLPIGAGIGIKPMSAVNTKRLVASAITYAVDNGLSSVTLMHKGNIMKFTEGAFRQWGYEVAAERFSDKVITEADVYAKHGGHAPEGMGHGPHGATDAVSQNEGEYGSGEKYHHPQHQHHPRAKHRDDDEAVRSRPRTL